MGAVLIAYGGCVLAGAVIRFREDGNRASLVTGAVSALALGICGAAELLGYRGGAYFGMGMTFSLVLIFGMRYAQTRKMLPSGMLLAASILAGAFLYARLLT